MYLVTVIRTVYFQSNCGSSSDFIVVSVYTLLMWICIVTSVAGVANYEITVQYPFAAVWLPLVRIDVRRYDAWAAIYEGKADIVTCQSKLLSKLLLGSKGGTVVAQYGKHLLPVWPAPMPYVGWICCQVSSLLREVSLRVTRVFPYPKNVAIPNSISTRDQVDHEKILKKEIKTILIGFFWSEVKRLGSRLFLVHLDWVEWINS